MRKLAKIIDRIARLESLPPPTPSPEGERPDMPPDEPLFSKGNAREISHLIAESCAEGGIEFETNYIAEVCGWPDCPPALREALKSHAPALPNGLRELPD